MPVLVYIIYSRTSRPIGQEVLYGAGDEARTRYLHLGKVALYRMSYTRISCSAFAEQAGASGRNRTNDTRIFSPLLYLLSYRGIFFRCASGTSLTAWVLYRRKGHLSTYFYKNVKNSFLIQSKIPNADASGIFGGTAQI